jgi:D123
MRYRTSALKTSIITLTPSFLDYLREDGLWLPNDTPYEETPWSAQNASKPVDPDWESDAKPNDASQFQDVHDKIQAAIAELGGSVVPKLNWSSPKDALHMALTKNSMACKSANDIYLLLKSSIFVTHDLEHAFDDCVGLPSQDLTLADIPYKLILRPFFKINTFFEFRCFVKDRTLIGISQRDLTYVGYPPQLLDDIESQIQSFFDKTLKTFPDPNFVFDIYIPEPHTRVRLIDINPWAPRTDPLLFSWLELLELVLPSPLIGTRGSTSRDTELPKDSSSDEETEEDNVEEMPFRPEFRVVNKDDPEAYNFGTAPYSAHKLPKEVVDASIEGGDAMKVLMEQWEKLMKGDLVEDDDSDEGGARTPTAAS